MEPVQLVFVYTGITGVFENQFNYCRVNRFTTTVNSSLPGDSEKNCVVVHFLHAVVLEQDSAVGINIGPGVLDLDKTRW